MYGRVFFFKQKTAYEWRISDWSSDVCSSDLFRVVAVGRSEHDDAGFKHWLRGRLDDGDDRDAAVVDDLLARIHYLSLDLNDAEAMRTALSPYADRPCVSYLSTPPDLFEPACRGLKAAGLLEGHARPVPEKPNGRHLSRPPTNKPT